MSRLDPSLGVTADEWRERIPALELRTKAFIGGEFVDAAAGQTFAAITPLSGQTLAQIALCEDVDVDRAVASAREAFEDRRWRRLSPTARGAVLRRLGELLLEHRDELALLETIDVGKPIGESLTGDIPASAGSLEYFGTAIDKVYDHVAPTDPSVTALIRREPIGVVAAVVPWNFPLGMAMWKVAPSLAVGNSVVLKPAEQSPLTALRFAELAIEAGVPEGVLNVVPGPGEITGAALGLHPDVDKVFFTGSSRVGKLFLEYAGRSNMKAVSLECGGKNPMIVLADTPSVEAAAAAVTRGAFYNQGEVCNASSRVLVDRSVRDELVERVVELSAAFAPGDPLDSQTKMGALVDEVHMSRVLGYIEAGVDEGATAVSGGRRAREESGGFFVEPTVFTDVRSGMRIEREEIFGPVLSIVDCDGVDEAIAIANDSPYGLAATVWTKDIDKAHALASSLRTGMVCVNGYSFGGDLLPFGGVKESGTGRDQSTFALDEHTLQKTLWIQHQPA